MNEFSLVPNSQFAAGSFSQIHVCVRDGVKYATKIYDKNCLKRKSNRLKRADAATAVKNELATLQFLKESGCPGVLCHEDILETEEELMIVFKMCRPILIPQPGAEDRFECVWAFRDARPSEDVVAGYVSDRWTGICEPSVNTYITPAGGQLPLKQVANAMRSVCSAVAAMHCLGICHRDIKVENVLQLGGQILLADFSHCVKTSESTTGGTGAYPLYSPQEARGEAFSVEMADVWQLGVLFYVFLFGCLPVDCVGVGTLLEKLRALPDDFPPPPPDRSRWDSRLVENGQWLDLLNGMLRVNECERYDLRGVRSHPFLAPECEIQT
ncbi:MAG: uncharacterized protein KVP18_000762 [Porospora cf. gigantea A]|uniref:uncharacterized protein n=1 Tax=Porospora cf. gigantea A TaxID=2853593 RepID=UPI0035598588|nr:MAG: hypothetical protein KVP18_000762 [Porospora cf. gigantea A]